MIKQNGNIFVIDDEPNIRATIKEALEEEGYQVSCYENPLRGLEDASRKNPDLIVTDLLMPELSGLELIHKTKVGIHETIIHAQAPPQQAPVDV